MLKAFPVVSLTRKAVAIGNLSAAEWLRLYELSRQTRPAVWVMTPDQYRRRILKDTSPHCSSIQLLDPTTDTILAACFLNPTLLHSPSGSRRVPYITQLNRDLSCESYRGTGSLLLDTVLEGTGSSVYLKPANRELEKMYQGLGFVPTDYTGAGNPWFPIYSKSVPHL